MSIKKVLSASMGRRGFFRAALAAPAAAQAAQDAIVKEFTGIGMGFDLLGDTKDNPAPPQAYTNGVPAAEFERTRRALSNPVNREAARSLLFEQNRYIHRLDHDLASKRSFSLAAKITFQRQRVVERDLADRCGPSAWLRWDRFMSRLLNDRFAGPISVGVEDKSPPR